jgi:hypothetical protein
MILCLERAPEIKSPCQLAVGAALQVKKWMMTNLTNILSSQLL